MKNREYKVPPFDFTARPNGDGTPRRILTPEAKTKTINRLARTGCVVRDVFYTGKISELPERRESH